MIIENLIDFSVSLSIAEPLTLHDVIGKWDEERDYFALKRLPAAMTALTELQGAMLRYPAFNSAHEGYAVLLEEVDELWTEVKKRPSARDVQAMRAEAVQVAAMALRFIIDCCEEGETST